MIPIVEFVYKKLANIDVGNDTANLIQVQYNRYLLVAFKRTRNSE